MSISSHSHEASPPDEMLGASRRNLWLAAISLAVAAFWIIVIPGLNKVLDYDDPIKEGQRLLVAPGITFEPPTGWNLEAGLRTTDRTRTNAPGAPVKLGLGPINASIGSSPAATGDTPESLIEQIEHTSVKFDDSTLTASGETITVPVSGWKVDGLAEHYAAPDSEGVAAAFVIDGTEVIVKVVGPAAEMNEQAEAIGQMLASFAYKPATDSRQKSGK